MPIASYKPDSKSPVELNVPKIQPIESKSIVVDTKKTPLASLISYISGSSWIVDYYAQVINSDNDIRGQDTGQNSIYQQYTRIKGLELKVSNPLSQSQNNEDKRMVVSGTASMYPFMIPNEGDMFAADVGDGREGIFRIKTSEKKSFLQQPTYSIDYDLVYFTDDQPHRKTDLDAKSIRTLFYKKELMSYGQNPLLIEEDYQAIVELTKLYSEIVRNYFNWFFNNEFKTIIVPGQEYPTYDNYVVQTLLSILTSRDDERVKFIKQLNCTEDEYIKQPELFKALVNRDQTLLELGNHQMGLVNTKLFNKDPMMESIAYGGIKYIVYPARADLTLNSVSATLPKECSETITSVQSRQGDITHILSNPSLTDNTTQPDIFAVLIDNKYVLSDAFYNQQGVRSTLELLTQDYLDRKPISACKLYSLVKTYKNWGGLERYYYLVIVLILIKSAIRSI